MHKINDIESKLLTAEDPVEYDIEGIMQVAINESVGMTFMKALRSFLRQDPDIIMIGEMRDIETAQIAIQSSLTGHLVLSTLHTNDAPSATTRMLDLGLESFLIAATLEAIVAQRLVRKICNNCKDYFEPEPEQAMELGLRPEAIVGKKFAYGKGCSRCNSTGYKGRMALYEMFRINDEIKQMIMDGAQVSALREAGRRHGMRTLRESGLLAIYDCGTSIEEVMRETLVLE
jgi:type IV pilus assembly protein PilB